MKKSRCLAAALLLGVVFSAAAEGFDFLVSTEWFIDSEIDSREPQRAFFRRNELPKDIAFYRQQVSLKTYFLFYPYGDGNMVWIGWDYNKDGIDDVLNIMTKDQYSYFMLVQPEKSYLLLAGGTRKGVMRYPGHPFVGTWLRGNGTFASEVRLVRPADYLYFMRLTEIRGYGIRDGWYLLRHVGGGVFESDDTFEDGHVRLEVKSEKELLLTPLFALPKGEGLTTPVRLRARG